MTTVWFLIILISMPNAPSVKYNGYLYRTEEECQVAKYELHETYNNQSTEYKAVTLIDSHCIEYKSFSIKGLNKIKGRILGA